MLILLVIVTAVQAYLIGGINGAIIISKYIYRKDIRKFGSGNPGLTNFYRVFGKGVAGVVLIDALKTIAPVIIGGFLFAHFLPADTFSSGNIGFFSLSFLGSELAGFFVMLGHCYPPFYELKGGKGVMAVGTMIFFIDWRIALAAWATFIILTVLTRYVSLGAMAAVSLYPLLVGLFNIGGAVEFCIALASAGLLVFRHKENIIRLVKGTESKFSFHRKKDG